MRNPRINIRISPEQNMFLEDLAARTGTTKSFLVQEALNRWINVLIRLEEIAIIQVKQPE